MGPTLKNNPFLPLVRDLVRCYQAFEMYSAAHIREMDLTPSQFDIIATLGNTDGMSCTELTEKTLITKGTLTGVVDRLIAKGLVRRIPSEHDGRSHIIQLTEQGVGVFDQVFPDHIVYMGKVFAEFKEEDYSRIQKALQDLHGALKKS